MTKRDLVFSGNYYYAKVGRPSRVASTSNNHSSWSWMPTWPKNGDHHLLSPSTSDISPTISACTTATNLSSLEFQSNSTIAKYPLIVKHQRGMMEQNIRAVQPEVEPLNTKTNDKNVNCSAEELESSAQLYAKKSDKFPFRQLLSAVAVSIVSMVCGYVSAYTAPATLSMKRDFGIKEYEISWISGLMPLMALFGGLMGGTLIEYFGRKKTLLITDILFLLGWIVNYFALTYWHMYVSRMIMGCGVGIATLTLPVYLGETVQPEVRGSLGLLPTAFGNIGILMCFLLGMKFEWQGIAGFGALLPLPFLVLIWFIPETPRWYISKGKTEEARQALEWLRDKNNPEIVAKEFEDLMRTQKISEETSDSFAKLFGKTNLKSLCIVLGLMFFQQWSGINAVIFYTTEIFKDTGSGLDASMCTVIVGVVNFISTFIATFLIDRLGRKALLYISSVAMIITLSSLGTYFYLNSVVHADLSAVFWLPLASSMLYVLGFSLGFGPIPWLMMGEILPAKIRGPAASVSTGFNWSSAFIVTTTFPLFRNSIGPYGIFWLFGAITVIGLVFTILFVPETRGQSLEDIERKLAGVKVRRMSSVANLKPTPL